MKALEVAGADLDYSRYGDTLFELLFTGGRSAGGGTEVEYGESKLVTNVRLTQMRGWRATPQPRTLAHSPHARTEPTCYASRGANHSARVAPPRLATRVPARL